MIGRFQSLKDRFTPPAKRKSFGLHGLDHRLAEHVTQRNGFFIEAGANDGIRQSNTLYFEKYLGWEGLLIEPLPRQAQEAKKNRPFCRVESCALVDPDRAGHMIGLTDYDLMSVMDMDETVDILRENHREKAEQYVEKNQIPTKHLNVQGRCLSSVLDELDITQIDLLSLDVEGGEPYVLQGLDLPRHAPRWILVEVRSEDAIQAILDPFYRKHAVLSENPHYRDILYRRRGSESS